MPSLSLHVSAGNTLAEAFTISSDSLNLYPFTTGSSSVVLSHLAWSISNNNNVVLKLRSAVYDAPLNLLSSSAEMTVINPNSAPMVTALTSPVTLAANSVYYFAWWSDSAVYVTLSAPYSNPCNHLQYSAAADGFPNPFVPNANGGCASVPVAGFACTTPAQPSPGTGDNTGSTSSSSTGIGSTGGSTIICSEAGGGGGSGLSDGAVAGIVVGCSVGVAVLVAVCVLLLLRGVGGVAALKSGMQRVSTEERPSADSSRIEMSAGARDSSQSSLKVV
jgi:hypothetical protein